MKRVYYLSISCNIGRFLTWSFALSWLFIWATIFITCMHGNDKNQSVKHCKHRHKNVKWIYIQSTTADPGMLFSISHKE